MPVRTSGLQAHAPLEAPRFVSDYTQERFVDCLGTSTSPKGLKFLPTHHLPSLDPAGFLLPGGPKPPGSPVSLNKARESRVKSLVRVERQGPEQLTPKRGMGGPTGGEEKGSEGVRLGASVELCFLESFGCSSCLGARAVTAKDTSQTAPKRDCQARKEATGGTYFPTSARTPGSMPFMPQSRLPPRKATQHMSPRASPEMPGLKSGTQQLIVTCLNSGVDGDQQKSARNSRLKLSRGALEIWASSLKKIGS